MIFSYCKAKWVFTFLFQTRTYIHLFDECTQNWFAVASIIEHTLTTLKVANPNIQEAFLRSDNAGCYHCAYLILSLPSIGERAGIKIARYDFSDPQAGKDVCDRRIAAVKGHMRRYINEGHDIKSASDMKAAIDSYGGVKGCQAAVVKIQESSQTTKKHTMSGIQALNNFSFESGGLRVWRAYNVGPGKSFTPAQVKGFRTPQGPQTYALCIPSAYRKWRLELSDLRPGEMSSDNLSLVHQSLSKKRRQLTKLQRRIFPALRRDVQRHTSLLQVSRNTWMLENTLCV